MYRAMKTVCWRTISSQKNSFAALYAACERFGYDLQPVQKPEGDIVCYSLNSINASHYYQEIAESPVCTIVGGPHATACYPEITGIADYVIVGEGEYTLPSLISWIDGKNPRFPTGVATKNHYTPRDTTVILDSFPCYTKIKGYIEISRGCPFSCSYCQTPAIFGHLMRHRSLYAIQQAAKSLHHVRLLSPNALAYGSNGREPHYQSIRSLLSMLHDEMNKEVYFGTFPAEVRPEFVTPESLDLIRRYCANTRLHFGAQSGSDRVLERLNRRHTVHDVCVAVENCRDADIIPVVDIIMGFPFEDDEDQKETLHLIRWIARYGTIHLHRFIPLPGTPLAGTSPRDLIPGADATLGKLALHGFITGSWNRPEIRFSTTNSNNNV